MHFFEASFCTYSVRLLLLLLLAINSVNNLMLTYNNPLLHDIEGRTDWPFK